MRLIFTIIFLVACSHWDRYLGMTAAMTQVPVPTASQEMMSGTATNLRGVRQNVAIYGVFSHGSGQKSEGFPRFVQRKRVCPYN